MYEHHTEGGKFELNQQQREQRKAKRRHAERQIWQGIETAESEQRAIDHRTARLIAEQLHGPDSPLHLFATTGQVLLQRDEFDVDSHGILDELWSCVNVLPEAKQPWLGAMTNYVLSREDDPGPVRGWQQLTASPEQEGNAFTPQIYVVSLEDELAVNRVGGWIDADQDPDGLQVAIQELLEQSTMPDAVVWEIFDHTNFGGVDVFALVDEGDPESTLETVSRVALGVAEHGRPFAAYVSQFGAGQEICDQFARRYLGRWQSAIDYAKHYAEDLEWDSHIQQLPGWMAEYVTLDWQKLADHLEDEIEVLDGPNGTVYLFAAD